ncbi:MAG: glycosyltransferase family 2 protein [Candidatus Helarchaeota archaeon]
MEKYSKNLIIIPAYNQEKELKKLLRNNQIKEFDVIIINDGSTDRTEKVAKDFCVKVLNNRTNLGYGASLKKGIEYARNNSYKRIITLDSDGAHDLCEINTLLSFHIKANADLTIGSRLLNIKSGKYYYPESKQNVNIFGTYLINKIWELNLTDVASGFRVIQDTVFNLPMESNDMGFTYELIYKTFLNNLKISECGISVKYDAEKVFATNFSELISFLNIINRFNNRNSTIAKNIEKLIMDLKQYKKVFIKVESNYYVIYPLESEEAFMFQRQHPFYIHEPTKYINF